MLSDTQNAISPPVNLLGGIDMMNLMDFPGDDFENGMKEAMEKIQKIMKRVCSNDPII